MYSFLRLESDNFVCSSIVVCCLSNSHTRTRTAAHSCLFISNPWAYRTRLARRVASNCCADNSSVNMANLKRFEFRINLYHIFDSKIMKIVKKRAHYASLKKRIFIRSCICIAIVKSLPVYYTFDNNNKNNNTDSAKKNLLNYHNIYIDNCFVKDNFIHLLYSLFLSVVNARALCVCVCVCV